MAYRRSYRGSRRRVYSRGRRRYSYRGRSRSRSYGRGRARTQVVKLVVEAAPSGVAPRLPLGVKTVQPKKASF